MKVFIGRQPILDRNQRTIGYELLFRSGTANYFDGTDAREATAIVVSNAFLSIGRNRTIGSKLGFINFPRPLLVEDRALLLPPNVVIEVLENVEADHEVVEACKRLKNAGHSIALDDIVSLDHGAPLVPYARYAKIDLLGLEAGKRRELARHFHKHGLTLVAEKVETKPDFEAARDDGYDLFQGYFFARPEILSASRVAPAKMNYLRLLSEVNQPRLNFKRIEELLRLDVALVQKLLFFINSAVFSFPKNVDSISFALVALGEANIRKWVPLSAIPALASDRPYELVVSSLVRARFCELIAERCGCSMRASDCFLVGLLSLLDAMVGRPIEELVAEMALDPAISAAIVSDADSPMRRALTLARACESSDCERITASELACNLPAGGAAELYMRAMEWAVEIESPEMVPA